MALTPATSSTRTGPPKCRPTPVRVMIVEDSRVIREVLTYAISQDPRLEIASVVESGEKAIELLHKIKPDVISMDIRLPGIDGLETIRRIMAQRPTPIVVVAADVESEDLKISINALRAGALSVLEKQTGSTQALLENFADRLCTQLIIMSQVRVITQRSPAPDKPLIPHSRPPRRPPCEMVGIVASTGGPNALVHVLGALGPDFPRPILLVQHITRAFSKAFIDWLGSVCTLPVLEARDRQLPQPGSVYVAPADAHLILQNKRLKLDHRPPVSSQRPSGTVMLSSMAHELGPAALGVLLTGMGEDGALGLRDIKAAGGHTLAEHESTAVVYGMPAAAVALDAVCESIPLPRIAQRLSDLVHPQGAPPNA